MCVTAPPALTVPAVGCALESVGAAEPCGAEITPIDRMVQAKVSAMRCPRWKQLRRRKMDWTGRRFQYAKIPDENYRGARPEETG